MLPIGHERKERTVRSPSVDQETRVLALELPEAVHAQVEGTRALLQADALAAGSDPAVVDAALEAAAERFADAHVHAFIGILVEREVRERLRLRRAFGARATPPPPATSAESRSRPMSFNEETAKGQPTRASTTSSR